MQVWVHGDSEEHADGELFIITKPTSPARDLFSNLPAMLLYMILSHLTHNLVRKRVVKGLSSLLRASRTCHNFFQPAVHQLITTNYPLSQKVLTYAVTNASWPVFNRYCNFLTNEESEAPKKKNKKETSGALLLHLFLAARTVERLDPKIFRFLLTTKRRNMKPTINSLILHRALRKGAEKKVAENMLSSYCIKFRMTTRSALAEVFMNEGNYFYDPRNFAGLASKGFPKMDCTWLVDWMVETEVNSTPIMTLMMNKRQEKMVKYVVDKTGSRYISYGGR